MQEVPGVPDGRIPYRASTETALQVAATLAALSLAGPMALGGMPVIPTTVEDERRRAPILIAQQSESNVGVYQTSYQAEVGLALSQQRLASVTRDVDDIRERGIEERDVLHAAHRVLAGEVEPVLTRRFKSAFGHVVNDTVDLFILRDNEEHARDACR